MSAAETLREAAASMRARAEAATEGRWTHEDAPNGFPSMVIGNGMVVADTYDEPDLPDAAHIAGMDPTVAITVADWLDTCARLYEYGDVGQVHWHNALTVARRYLRIEADA